MPSRREKLAVAQVRGNEVAEAPARSGRLRAPRIVLQVSPVDASEETDLDDVALRLADSGLRPSRVSESLAGSSSSGGGAGGSGSAAGGGGSAGDSAGSSGPISSGAGSTRLRCGHRRSFSSGKNGAHSSVS